LESESTSTKDETDVSHVHQHHYGFMTTYTGFYLSVPHQLNVTGRVFIATMMAQMPLPQQLQSPCQDGSNALATTVPMPCHDGSNDLATTAPVGLQCRPIQDRQPVSHNHDLLVIFSRVSVNPQMAVFKFVKMSKMSKFLSVIVFIKWLLSNSRSASKYT